jgi:hypothetical protein
VFGSVLETDVGGVLTGGIAFDIHQRGKAVWLEAHFHPLVMAFGDSPEADGPVMDYALKGFMVDPGTAFHERNRVGQCEFSILHFADPLRRLDPISSGAIAGKYGKVTGRHRGYYEGRTVHGPLRIPRCFDPDADLDRVVRDADRTFAIAGMKPGAVAPSAFVELVRGGMPPAVDRLIDEVLVEARRLGRSGSLRRFPRSRPNQSGCDGSCASPGRIRATWSAYSRRSATAQTPRVVMTTPRRCRPAS